MMQGAIICHEGTEILFIKLMRVSFFSIYYRLLIFNPLCSLGLLWLSRIKKGREIAADFVSNAALGQPPRAAL
jgi:hypothetical protein